METFETIICENETAEPLTGRSPCPSNDRALVGTPLVMLRQEVDFFLSSEQTLVLRRVPLAQRSEIGTLWGCWHYRTASPPGVLLLKT